MNKDTVSAQGGVGFTPGTIRFEGWFPAREPGLLPSVKADWEGRMLQLFSQDLEQAEIDMKLLCAAPELLKACKVALNCIEPTGQDTKSDRAIALLQTVIFKAEGRQ